MLNEKVTLVADGSEIDVGAHEDGKTCVAYTHETREHILVNWEQKPVGTYLVLNHESGRWKLRACIAGRFYEGHVRQVQGCVFRGTRTEAPKVGIN
jgi:hypothetical protein